MEAALRTKLEGEIQGKDGEIQKKEDEIKELERKVAAKQEDIEGVKDVFEKMQIDFDAKVEKYKEDLKQRHSLDLEKLA
jgi:Skp family chaperone for outer membrane proteins